MKEILLIEKDWHNRSFVKEYFKKREIEVIEIIDGMEVVILSLSIKSAKGTSAVSYPFVYQPFLSSNLYWQKQYLQLYESL